MRALHREEKCLHFVNTACSLGANTFRPIGLVSAEKRRVILFRSEEAAAYFVPIHIDGSLDEGLGCSAHPVNVTFRTGVRNGWKADIRAASCNAVGD